MIHIYLAVFFRLKKKGFDFRKASTVGTSLREHGINHGKNFVFTHNLFPLAHNSQLLIREFLFFIFYLKKVVHEQLF